MLGYLVFRTIFYYLLKQEVSLEEEIFSKLGQISDEDILVIQNNIDYDFHLSMVYFISFSITIFCRILISVYLICKWTKVLIDPTYIESKLRFYQFFTLGLLEFCVQSLGIYLFMELHILKNEKYHYAYKYLVMP